MERIKRISHFLTRVNIAIFVHAAYILGIGVVSVVGRAFGARFLDEEATRSTWKKPTGSKEEERMY